jgi:hypothetical protein
MGLFLPGLLGQHLRCQRQFSRPKPKPRTREIWTGRSAMHPFQRRLFHDTPSSSIHDTCPTGAQAPSRAAHNRTGLVVSPISARRLRKKKAAAAAGERRGEERLREGATQATLYPTTTRREHAIQDASPPCLLQWGRVAHRVLRCHGRERRGDFARRPFESSNIRFAPHVSTTPFLHFATFSPFIVGGLG